MKFIGIDPGMNGSIASLTKIGKGPKYNLHSTGKLGDYSEHDLIEYLTSLGSADQDVFAVVEKVGVMPHMGVRAAFTFGRMYGILIASITASGIPFIEVPGATWQKALGCLVRGRKGANDGYKGLPGRKP